jgi:5-methylcytosine-specific restriction endonuclease McrA
MNSEQIYQIVKASLSEKDERGEWLNIALLAMSNIKMDSDLLNLCLKNITSKPNCHKVVKKYKSLSVKSERIRYEILGLSQMTLTPPKNKKCKLKRKYYKDVWIETNLKSTFLNGIENRGFYKSHIDHIVPISYGFKNNIPISLISSIENLRMISSLDNMKKNFQLTKESKNLLKKWGYEISKD